MSKKKVEVATPPKSSKNGRPKGPHQCAAPSSRKSVALIVLMALVKFGGGVAGMSGKVGGTVFSRNTYGAIARNWTKPVFKATDKQLAVNAAFGAQSQAWRTLTDAQRVAWKGLASTVAFLNRLGESIYLSGQAMFNKLNQQLLSVGAAAIDDAPAYTIPSSPLTLAAVVSDVDFRISFTPTPVPAGVAFQVWATPQLSPGKEFVKNLFKLVRNLPAATATAVDVFAQYKAIYGTTIVGQVIYVQIRAVDVATGVASPFIQYRAVVA